VVMNSCCMKFRTCLPSSGDRPTSPDSANSAFWYYKDIMSASLGSRVGEL
jgi:hypothetical protein